ncbi:MAG: B12-binding domain-containing radical SAM protein [Nanoarchaeota archaeon]|nr:B12-binding domain-containing radical SAM protein [Nanoarchaeota archaeon]
MTQKPKILLINPPLSGSLTSGIFTVKVPLGLAYIASYLEKHNFKPEILDCMAYYENIKKLSKNNYRIGLSEKEIIKKLKQFNPDIVGVSGSYTIHEKDSFAIADLVKKHTKALVVFGGAHTSAIPHSVLKNKNVDIAVIGEGELTFLDIVKNHKTKKLYNLKGIAFRKQKSIKINPIKEYIENLDDLPFPAHHLLPMEKYLKHPQNSFANMRGPTTEIITSRGCPYNCIFCSIHTVWGKKWRARSAKNVVDELEHLHKKYKIKEFRFFDDNLTWKKDRIMEICNEIIQRKLKIKWDTPNGVAIATLDEEVLKKMKQAGYYKIVMGIESGSEQTLRFMRKPVMLKKAREIIKICNKLGIWTWSTFVIGFPDESIKEIQKTIDFSKNSGLNFATFYIAQPYEGTDMYDVYKKKGLLKDGLSNQSSVTNSKYDTNHFTAEQLAKIQKNAYSGFIKHRMISYLNPIKLYKEFLNRIKSFEDLYYVLRMFKNLVGKEYSPIYQKD